MNHPRVLVIDDEPDIVHAIEFALLRANMLVEKSETAGDGLEKLNNSAFDLIILDVGLPDENGFEVLKKIRQYGEIPVVMLTAQHEEIDRILGLELGADDYIGKPFSPRELVARVKAILKRSRGDNQQQIARAHIAYHYDEERQEIYFHDKKIPLTVAELRIFSLMLAYPQRVFSREQLIDAAFSSGHPSDLRTIDTHIKKLRQKLRDSGGADCIRTHRALGYSYQP